MDITLIRYWFEFSYEHFNELPPGLGIGCGVTAFTYEDAINIMKSKVFKEMPTGTIKKVIEDVDIRNLDQGHVIPNMKPPIERGIWFPLAMIKMAQCKMPDIWPWLFRCFSFHAIQLQDTMEILIFFK